MCAVLLHGLVPGDAVRVLAAPDHALVFCAGTSALVTTAPPDLNELGTEALAKLALQHHAVLVAYCADGEVLPMRFGAAFSSIDAVRLHLQQAARSNLRAMRALAGMREYLVCLSVMGDPPLPEREAVTGRDFLARGRDIRDRRTSLSQRRSSLARHMLADLQEMTGHIEAAGVAKPDRLLDVALLLHVRHLAELNRLFQDRGPEANALGLDLRINGPWPAYSFKLPQPEECHGA